MTRTALRKHLQEIADTDVARAFLTQHASSMPRTMLRYSIEKFPADERAAWRAQK